MKLIFLVVSFIGSTCFGQTKTLFVEYKTLDDNGGYIQWFNNTEIIYSWLSPIGHYNEIPLIIDGKLVSVKDTDTLLYAREIKEFYEKANREAREMKQTRYFRKTNSSLLLYPVILDSKTYLVSDTIKPMTDWAIEEDTLTILGYKCQKATTNFYGTPYIAYFTTALEFTGGPKNFRGLPGIILKVVNPKKHTGYVATEIEYPFAGRIPEIPINAKSISSDEYKKCMKHQKIKR